MIEIVAQDKGNFNWTPSLTKVLFYFYLPNSAFISVLRPTDGTARTFSHILYDLPAYAATGIQTRVRQLHLSEEP